MVVKEWTDRTNMSMLADFYEMTMAKGYLEHDMAETEACFDMFFRSVPQNGGFAIMAGVEQLVDYLKSLRFTKEDIKWLKNLDVFEETFLDYLANFKFTCDVWAIPEGTPIFPGEPIVKVKGPIIQAQMLETMILVTINHPSLIATKSARIVRAAKGRPVLEFGARRAQGYDAAVLGARAAYIAGVAGTSCTICGQEFAVPVLGTMAHSWIQAFDNEYDAFASYAKSFPDDALFLVDTYNTLNSGMKAAIKVAKEVLEPMGKRLKGIRIDSGDLTYLTIEARKMLDEAGLEDAKITVSNALDEYIIRDLIQQGAQIDSFGVGERLITSKAEPVFGGVYKLAAIKKGNEVFPKIKMSDNAAKITNPGDKEVWRIYDLSTGKALADVITLADEIIEGETYKIFDPEHTWKQKTLKNFRAEKLLKPLFLHGEMVHQRRDIQELKTYCAEQLDTLWDSIKRFDNPQTYFVDLSKQLWTLKEDMLYKEQERVNHFIGK